MKYCNKILLTVGLFSITFQLFNFKSLSDILCLVSSIGILFLIFAIVKDNLCNKYSALYKKFYILALLVYINNVLIYLSLPQALLVSFKIVITILLILIIIRSFKHL